MKLLIRFISVLIVSSVLFAAFGISADAETYYYLLGDTDADSDISITDATLIQRKAADMIMLSGVGKLAADVDSDGEITVMDSTAIQMWLVSMKVNFPIGQTERKETDDRFSEPIVSADGKSVTVDDVTFDVSRIPTSVTIDDSTANLKTNLVLKPKSEINPYDITVIVNNGMCINKIDYSNPIFKESYLMEKDSDILHGYDCSVVDETANEIAYVYAHYKAGYVLPYQFTVYCFGEAHSSFPIDFYYKDQLIRRTMVNVNTSSGPDKIEATKAAVNEIESKCWTPTMTDKEKMEAFGQYIKSNYSYSQIMCVTGAVYTAWAARDLGLTSMLLYPGGELNQQCERHIVTYNIYQSTSVPGGHCACLIEYEDGLVRYDVQGGACVIQPYQFPEQ